MREQLRELWQYRELLIILVKRDLKVRYKNSVLGFGWSLLNPLVQVLTITMVLKFIMGSRSPNYHAYVFCGTLPWIFFSTAVMDSSLSLVKYQNLLRRIYFPREIIPLSAVLANLIHFFLAAAVFLVYMAALPLFWWAMTGRLDWPVQWSVILTPLPILGLVLFVTGISLVISVWTLYFEDIHFLADSGLKILYWLVPVVYFSDIIVRKIAGERGELVHAFYMLNPLATFITAFRKLTLPPTVMPGLEQLPLEQRLTTPMGGAEWLFLGVALLVSLGTALLGYRYFSARKWTLAERA